MPPQFLKDTTAETTKAALESACMPSPGAQAAEIRIRTAQSDRLSSQRKAEKHIRRDRGPSWFGTAITDLVHNISGSEDKTMQLIKEAIGGMMAIVNSLDMQNFMEVFRASVRQFCTVGIRVVDGEPQREATEYIKFVCDLFVSPGPNNAERRTTIESLPNGEWRVYGDIPVHRGGLFFGVGVPEIISIVSDGLTDCVGGHRPHGF